MLVLLANITLMGMYSNGKMCKVIHMGNFNLSWAWNLIVMMLVWNIVVHHYDLKGVNMRRHLLPYIRQK